MSQTVILGVFVVALAGILMVSSRPERGQQGGAITRDHTPRIYGSEKMRKPCT